MGVSVKQYWKAILIVLVILAGLGWFLVDSIQERAAMTQSATGTVTRVAFDPDEEAAASTRPTSTMCSTPAAGRSPPRARSRATG
jgi:hypothetical protein